MRKGIPVACDSGLGGFPVPCGGRGLGHRSRGERMPPAVWGVEPEGNEMSAACAAGGPAVPYGGRESGGGPGGAPRPAENQAWARSRMPGVIVPCSVRLLM